MSAKTLIFLFVFGCISLRALAVNPPLFKDSFDLLIKTGQDSTAEELINAQTKQWFDIQDESSLFEDGYFLSSALRKLHRVDAAVSIYERLAKIAKAQKDTLNIAETHFQLGRLYADQGIEHHALEELFSALSIFESRGINRRRAQALNQIGIVKKRQGFYEESITYFTAALEGLSEDTEDNLRSAVLNNLGSAYKRLKKYARAKEFFLRAIALNKRIDQKRWLSYNYNNLANIYEETGDLKNALIYHRMGTQLKMEVKDYPGLSTSYANMALVFEKKEMLDSALYYAELADDLAMEYNVAEIIPTALMQHARLLEALGEYDRAYFKIKQLHEYKDSLSTADKSLIISKIETKYEREKFEAENALLKKDLELQQAQGRQKDLLIIGFVIGILMLAVLVFLVVKAIIVRSRTNQALILQNESIQHQNEQIQAQKAEIEATNEKLHELQKEKDVFYSTITHDMRGPLNGIMATTQMLNDDATDEALERLQILDFSAQALSRLIDDLLDFNRHEAGRFQINPQPFDLKELILKTLNMYQFIAQENHLELSHDLKMDVTRFEGDRNRIGQVLFNLLGNSLKFTSKGFIKLGATTEQASTSNKVWVTITVEDSGIGIAKESVDTIFERFEQGLDLGTMSQLGSGLGLYVCKMIIGAMDGTIELKSEPGKGSTFTIRFQLTAIQPST